MNVVEVRCVIDLRLGQIMIRHNRYFPRFLRPDCSKEIKKSITCRKGLHATFYALPRA